jgi:hypothetical protein
LLKQKGPPRLIRTRRCGPFLPAEITSDELQVAEVIIWYLLKRV